jgi:hypothetical protein
MGGPYEYTVHVEQQAGDSYLDLNRGMNLSCTRVHRARVSACTSLLQLIVGEEFRLLRCDIVPVQIRKPRLPFLDQLHSLSAAPLGARQHPFRVLSLSGLSI